MSTKPIRERDRGAIIRSLQAGVVPLRGQHHIQVGRHEELKALIRDIDRIEDGGATFRFVIGAYGSGKTFFLNLVRSVAHERKLVTLHADLTPERRLFSTGGQARSLYAELMRNAATRSSPDGGALSGIVEKFVTSALRQAATDGVNESVVLQERLQELSEMVGGYDFAQVVDCYWRGHDTGDDQLKSDATRWLRAEFATRTDARKALGVRTIIDDSSVYDHLKLFARFVRLSGYKGVLVCLDELVNLYKLANTKARTTNYEQMLRILNDVLQGTVESIGFVLGGTPEFLTDTRRGLYSYAALQSRLGENAFATDGLVDYTGPVLRLASLSPEDLYILLKNLRHVFASGDESKHLVPDEALTAFMEHCSKRIGDAYFRTPRNTIKGFLHLLAVLDQNPTADWRELLGDIALQKDLDPDLAPLPEDAEEGDAGEPAGAVPEQDDDLTTFRL